jgi:hypothetical protein
MDEAPFAADFVVDHLLTPREVSSSQLAGELRAIKLERGLPATGAGPVDWSWLYAGRSEPSLWEREFGLPRTLRFRPDTLHSLARIQPDHVRDFMDSWYAPHNVTFVIIGNTGANILARMIERIDSFEVHGDVARSAHVGVSTGLVKQAFSTRQSPNSTVRMHWRVANFDERDYALALLFRNLLRHNVHDVLRARNKNAYEIDGVLRLSWGQLIVGIEAEVAPEAVDQARSAMLDAFHSLGAADGHPSEHWHAGVQRALDPLMRNTEPGDLFSFVSVLWQEPFDRFPPVTEYIRDVSPIEFADWINTRVAPGGRTDEIVRGVPGFSIWMLTLFFGGLVGVALGSNAALKANVELSQLRYVSRIYVTPTIPLLVIGVVLLEGRRLFLCCVDLQQRLEVLGSQWDSAFVHAVCVTLIPMALAYPFWLFVAWHPRKILVLNGELRVKSFGAWSVGIPWHHIREVRLCHGLDIAMSARVFGCWFCWPSLLRTGVYVRFRHGAFFFHCRDARALTAVLNHFRACATNGQQAMHLRVPDEPTDDVS